MDENADTVEDKSTREADDELSDEELSEVSGGETPTESPHGSRLSCGGAVEVAPGADRRESIWEGTCAPG